MPRWTWTCTTSLGAIVASLACARHDAPSIDGRGASTSASASTSSAGASSSAAPSPVRERHPGVSVPLTSGGLMSETAPYLVPDREPRPVTIILHALCSDERWMCDWLQYGALSPQWQVCPRAPHRCGNGGAEWTATTLETIALLELAVSTTKTRHPGFVADDAMVLVGMSQGAYAATRIVHALATTPSPMLRLRGLVLHGATVTLDPRDVKTLGLRVVLAAGDQDAAAPRMKALAKALEANGVAARYASFGAVGHFLPVDTATPMSELIAWARGE